MSRTVRKVASIDARGRITLPSEFRAGVDSFSIESKKNGVLWLIPQKSVSIEEADLLASLKKSIHEVKKGKTKPVPKEWIEE